ncbi:MAG: 50S ribosomal protein L5 [Candidatus Omnitrophica bacterium]|nr:50S ribosomal protein L5 [Candidatus Omnitrophota bacterium]
MATQTITAPRLQDKYHKEIKKTLMSEFQYKNFMQVPKIEKVIINIGAKEGQEDIKLLERFSDELGAITGQKPITIRAKKSISAFKLRQGSPIGLKVTLRGMRMYEFLDRLFNIAMPRIRDFRGYSDNSFDGRGNYSLGIQEQTIFPEIKYDEVKKIKGMDITIVTNAKTNEEAKRLLELLGFPFKKS